MSISINKVIKALPQKRQKRIQVMSDTYVKDYKNLQEFRKSMGLTQNFIAQHQGVKQVNVSNLEKRTDMHISTLKKYVEAMGCALEINIIIPDKSIARIENLTR